MTPVYDFGGFDPMYYRMRYDTPDATELGARVLGALAGGEPVHQQQSRGLDHGAWVPLKIMYPEADIPVLQLSMPTHDPDRLLRLGERLRALREEGVLVVGSGFMTHGLPFLTRSDFLGQTLPGWSADFDAWAAERSPAATSTSSPTSGSRAPGHALRAPDGRALHPAVRHARRGDRPRGAPVTSTIDGYWMGLSKRSLQVA